VPDVTDRWDGDGIGDSTDSDGEPIDNQVGDSRAGRLVAFDIDSTDPSTDHRAHDVGVDGGAASAEEAAIHIIAEEDTIASEGWRLRHSTQGGLAERCGPTGWARLSTADCHLCLRQAPANCIYLCTVSIFA
jgi:hypothetical protein